METKLIVAYDVKEDQLAESKRREIAAVLDRLGGVHVQQSVWEVPSNWNPALLGAELQSKLSFGDDLKIYSGSVAYRFDGRNLALKKQMAMADALRRPTDDLSVLDSLPNSDGFGGLADYLASKSR